MRWTPGQTHHRHWQGFCHRLGGATAPALIASTLKWCDRAAAGRPHCAQPAMASRWPRGAAFGFHGGVLRDTEPGSACRPVYRPMSAFVFSGLTMQVVGRAAAPMWWRRCGASSGNRPVSLAGTAERLRPLHRNIDTGRPARDDPAVLHCGVAPVAASLLSGLLRSACWWGAALASDGCFPVQRRRRMG